MSYIDAYVARINALGSNHKERELNASIRDFDKFLKEHPSVEEIVVDGVTTPASIISDRQDENKLVKNILTPLAINIHAGSLVTWKDRTWIVYKIALQPNPAYASSYMVQCNTSIKWINSYGVVNESPCYTIGNMIKTIKENFRTWNGLITPQPNQFLDCLIPANNIPIGTRFIITERAWQVVEYDTTSVPGVMYLSLTEDKVDRIEDNLQEKIADVTQLGYYKIIVPIETVDCKQGSEYILLPTVYQGDTALTTQEIGITMTDTETATARISNEKVIVTGVEPGTTTLKIYLLAEPKVFTVVDINIVAEEPTPDSQYMIVGNSAIRLGQQTEYKVVLSSNNDIYLIPDTASISNSDLASVNINDGKVYVTANSKNKLGAVRLTIVCDDITTEKDIAIRSLW